MNGREMARQTSAKLTNAQDNATKQKDGRKCRQTLAAEAANGSLGNNGKDNVGGKRLCLQPTNLARIYIHSACLSPSEISQTEYVRQREKLKSIFEKLAIVVHDLSNMRNAAIFHVVL